MAEVGVRELRDHLSKSPGACKPETNVVVTERGRAIARVLPMSGERTIDRLVREGKVSPAQTRKRSLPTAIKDQGHRPRASTSCSARWITSRSTTSSFGPPPPSRR